ncbi:hypothetical protein [Agrococcus sp. KRD186]|uniref:hypothetical protein n=1 Tax=Agrococcus sp. KRD186 TaxID=2729730 RepID=UPI0031455E7B
MHARDGMRIDVVEVESRLWALTSEPAVGIGQRALLVQTEAGNRGRSAARRTADPLRRSLPGLLHGALGAGQ